MIAAVFYFRIFQPGQSYSPIPIDFQEPPADPFEADPSGRIAAPSAPKVKLEQAKPILPKKVLQRPAPVKRVVMEVQAKREPAKPQPRIYTVKPGDSLWRIARDQLGDASRHLELAKLNEAVLDGDADSLKPGQIIILPPK